MCTFSILKIYRQLTTSKSRTNMPLPGKIVKLERKRTRIDILRAFCEARSCWGFSARVKKEIVAEKNGVYMSTTQRVFTELKDLGECG